MIPLGTEGWDGDDWRSDVPGWLFILVRSMKFMFSTLPIV